MYRCADTAHPCTQIGSASPEQRVVSVAYVEDCAQGGATGGLDLLDGGLEVLRVPVAHRKIGAKSREGDCHRLSDPDGGAGDQRDAIGQQRG